MKFNIPELRKRADAVIVSQKPQAKKLISTYTLVWAGFILISNLLSFTISDAYSDLTGLMSLDKGNKLLALSLLISLVASLGTLLLDAGYSSCALSLAQGQRTEEHDLLWGLHQFPRLLTCGLQLFLLFFLIAYGFIAVLLMFLPMELWFEGEMFSPLLMYITYGICSIVFFWLLYNRRLLYFFLARFEKGSGCLAGRSAVLLLKGYRLQFLRIDLSHWWYYLLIAAASIIPYGSLLLQEASPTTVLMADLICLALSVGLKAALFLGAKNRLWVMYALAFEDILKEKAAPLQEQPSGNLPENPLK